jgi:hypothetical protein
MTRKLPSCELHKRHLIEVTLASGTTTGEGLISDQLDALIGEGCLLTDYEAEAILAARGTLPNEMLDLRSEFPSPPNLTPASDD